MGKKVNTKTIATSIGSLPHTDPQEAVEFIFKYLPKCPAWPQLPMRSFKEIMHVQFAENFPCIEISEKSITFSIDETDIKNELKKFHRQFTEKNLHHFKVSEEFAAGLYEFINTKIGHPEFIKGQITGPITFGLSIRGKDGKSLLHHQQMQEIIPKHIAMKALFQVNLLKKILKDVILFIDEPSLTLYGTDYIPLSDLKIIEMINEVVKTIKKENVTIGIHCCGKTNWSLILATDIDILSFDSYNFFPGLMEYRKNLEEFLNRGGKISYGIVPSTKDILKEDVNSLLEKLRGQIKQIDSTDCFFITPSCGLGTQTIDVSSRSFEILAQLENKINETSNNR